MHSKRALGALRDGDDDPWLPSETLKPAQHSHRGVVTQDSPIEERTAEFFPGFKYGIVQVIREIEREAGIDRFAEPRFAAQARFER